MDDDQLILESLKDLGIQFWIGDGSLHFKYPPELSGEGKKDLYKFIKDHEQGIMRALQQ